MIVLEDGYEVCPVTKNVVLSCPCGPHVECPEHLLNCVLEDGHEP
jgi:hypothetical protein